MKFFLAGLLMVATSAAAFGQGVYLQQGDSYTFEFSSLPDAGPGSFTTRSGVIAWFVPASVGQGDKVLIELFTDSLNDTPASNGGSSVFVDSYDSPGGTSMPFMWGRAGPLGNPPPYFPDLQGIVRVTMLNGSAQLTGFEVSEVINGEFYSGNIQVPEPGSSCLLALGFLSFVFFRTRTHRETQKSKES
jgi:hypothetical protein